MTKFAGRAPAPVRVVFDGQSYNLWPPDVFSTDGLGPMPDRVMSRRGIPWGNVALGNHGWGTAGSTDPLHLFATIATRLFPQARNRAGCTDVLVMAGGSSDIYADHQTGAAVYARAVAYMTAARAAGFDVVVGVTIPPFAGALAPSLGDLQAITDHNTLMMGGSDFDAVVDVHVPPIDDSTNTTYFENDQVHWRTPGAIAAAAIVRPVIDAVLAGL